MSDILITIDGTKKGSLSRYELSMLQSSQTCPSCNEGITAIKDRALFLLGFAVAAVIFCFLENQDWWSVWTYAGFLLVFLLLSLLILPLIPALGRLFVWFLFLISDPSSLSIVQPANFMKPTNASPEANGEMEKTETDSLYLGAVAIRNEKWSPEAMYAAAPVGQPDIHRTSNLSPSLTSKTKVGIHKRIQQRLSNSFRRSAIQGYTAVSIRDVDTISGDRGSIANRKPRAIECGKSRFTEHIEANGLEPEEL